MFYPTAVLAIQYPVQLTYQHGSATPDTFSRLPATGFLPPLHIQLTFFHPRLTNSQAEYRWIEMFGHGKWINMPWWGGFDPRAWDVASLMDFAVPVVACLLIWLLVNRG